MTSTRRDGDASSLVAAVAVIYVAFDQRGPGVHGRIRCVHRPGGCG
jgi:hypothetical protein